MYCRFEEFCIYSHPLYQNPLETSGESLSSLSYHSYFDTPPANTNLLPIGTSLGFEAVSLRDLKRAICEIASLYKFKL